MPKAILEFNLPEETSEFRTAQLGLEGVSMYHELQSIIRQYQKSNLSKEWLVTSLGKLLEEYNKLDEL